MSVINLIPLGYLVLCPEMKQHFDLRTGASSQWVCEFPDAVSAGFASLLPPTGILEMPYWRVAGIPGKKRERKGELKTSLAKSTAAWAFCQLYLYNLLVVA